jgi:hypothetical protein
MLDRPSDEKSAPDRKAGDCGKPGEHHEHEDDRRV